MVTSKADIIARLRRDLLPLQGFNPVGGTNENVGLGQINHSFPNRSFPVGAMHEFISADAEDSTATSGFIAAVLGKLMKNGGASLWIGQSRTLFPPALKLFDIDPEKIIFINLRREKDVTWAMEEALKCDGLVAVVGEIQELNFTASRRFQLAVEQSHVTGFILRHNPRSLNITACVTRWKITHLPTILADEMPGVGFSRWNVELLKVRNGKPGLWQIEWIGKRFRHIPIIAAVSQEEQKKTG
jgi:protein ImuA